MSPHVIYLGSGLSTGKIVVYFKYTVCKASQKFSSYVGSRSFYSIEFTTQHKVHQVHKSLRYFHISYTNSLQSVSFLSKFSSMQNLYKVHQDSRYQLIECPTPALTQLNSIQLLPDSGPLSLNTIHSDIYYGIEHTLWF